MFALVRLQTFTIPAFEKCAFYRRFNENWPSYYKTFFAVFLLVYRRVDMRHATSDERFYASQSLGGAQLSTTVLVWQ